MSTTEKTCVGCGETKPLAEFYAHPGMADGHLPRCIPCFKAKAKENRLKRLEHWREHDRARAKSPDRRAKAIEHNRKDPKRAHRIAVGNAVRDGRLVPLPCFVCGGKAEAHHASYAPGMELVVMWLCQYHHQQCHGRLD